MTPQHSISQQPSSTAANPALPLLRRQQRRLLLVVAS
jgi:hypothetical protein